MICVKSQELVNRNGLNHAPIQGNMCPRGTHASKAILRELLLQREGLFAIHGNVEDFNDVITTLNLMARLVQLLNRTSFYGVHTTHVLNECHFSFLLLEGRRFGFEGCVISRINSVPASMLSEYLVWIISLIAR